MTQKVEKIELPPEMKAKMKKVATAVQQLFQDEEVPIAMGLTVLIELAVSASVACEVEIEMLHQLMQAIWDHFQRETKAGNVASVPASPKGAKA